MSLIDSAFPDRVAVKPLGGKAYGSIPHLPGSRLGPGDHRIHDGQARILTEQPRPGDWIIVQEKLDGSNCSVARVDGHVVALSRAGYLAQTSGYEQHQLFAAWVRENEDRFAFLGERERVCGEWLAQAHGTRYDLGGHEPYVVFDWFTADGKRRLFYDLMNALEDGRLWNPKLLHSGPDALSIANAEKLLRTHGFHGAIDPAEGAVWRVEREGRVDFLAKYVRPGKVDGCYLEKGAEPVWNWRPR